MHRNFNRFCELLCSFLMWYFIVVLVLLMIAAVLSVWDNPVGNIIYRFLVKLNTFFSNHVIIERTLTTMLYVGGAVFVLEILQVLLNGFLWFVNFLATHNRG